MPGTYVELPKKPAGNPNASGAYPKTNGQPNTYGLGITITRGPQPAAPTNPYAKPLPMTHTTPIGPIDDGLRVKDAQILATATVLTGVELAKMGYNSVANGIQNKYNNIAGAVRNPGNFNAVTKGISEFGAAGRMCAAELRGFQKGYQKGGLLGGTANAAAYGWNQGQQELKNIPIAGGAADILTTPFDGRLAKRLQGKMSDQEAALIALNGASAGLDLVGLGVASGVKLTPKAIGGPGMTNTNPIRDVGNSYKAYRSTPSFGVPDEMMPPRAANGNVFDPTAPTPSTATATGRNEKLRELMLNGASPDEMAQVSKSYAEFLDVQSNIKTKANALADEIGMDVRNTSSYAEARFGGIKDRYVQKKPNLPAAEDPLSKVYWAKQRGQVYLNEPMVPKVNPVADPPPIHPTVKFNAKNVEVVRVPNRDKALLNAVRDGWPHVEGPNGDAFFDPQKGKWVAFNWYKKNNWW